MRAVNPLSRARLARLIATIRHEGWRVAAARTKAFLSRWWQGQRYTPPEAMQRAIWTELAERQAFHAAPMRIGAKPQVVMIGDLSLAQCRKYRVAQLAALWAGAGVDYAFVDHRDMPRAISLMQGASHLMLYRVVADPALESLLYEARRLRLPVAYDIDDPLFSVSAYATYGNMAVLDPGLRTHFIAEAPRYLAAMAQADLITVSTPGLATHVADYLDRPVHVRRNFADPETLAAAAEMRPQKGPGFTLALASGSQGHEADFGLIRDDIAAFLGRDRTHRLRVLGHFNPQHLPPGFGAQIEQHAFTDYRTYLTHLAGADCVLTPLADDAFNRCKSAVRALDAFAVGVPVVASDVGDMASLVEDGVSGHLMAPGTGWRERLEALAADRDKTAAMGQAGRASLDTHWTARSTWPVVDPALVRWVTG